MKKRYTEEQIIKFLCETSSGVAVKDLGGVPPSGVRTESS